MKISLGLQIGRVRYGPYSPPPEDTTAPTFVSAIVSNSTPTKIVLTYSETLSATLTGTITVSGGKTVTSQTRVGSTVEVVVDSAYVFGDTITISVPLHCVKDVAGNSALALVDESVTNNVEEEVGAPPPPPPPNIATTWDSYYTEGWEPDTDTTALASVPADSKPARETTTLTNIFTDSVRDVKLHRVTDVDDVPVNGSGVASYYVRHEYSRRQAYNRDSTLRIAQSTPGFWWLYDTATNTRLDAGGSGTPAGVGSIIGLVGDCEPFWSVAPGEEDIIIHTARGGGTIWYKRNARTGAVIETRDLTTRIRALAGFSDVDALWFNGEGAPSHDQRYWFWSAEHYVGNNPVTRGYIRYDWEEDEFGPHLQHPDDNKPNWVGTSPDGEWGILSFYGTAAADLATEHARPLSSVGLGVGEFAAGGVRAYKWDFSEYKTLSVLGEHSDIGKDAYGNDVYCAVSFHGNGDEVTDGSVWYCEIANPENRYTLGINAFNSPDNGDTGVHISGLASYLRNGLFVVGRYNGTGGNPHDASTHVVELIPTGGKIYRLALHHTTGGDYWFEPHPSPNWDLTRILSASNWGGSDGEDYEIILPSTAFTVPGLEDATRLTNPTIAGTAAIGEQLTRTLGTYSGFPVPTVSGIWQVSTDGGSNWSDSTGFTGATSPVLTTNGHKIRWAETASNAGSSTSVGYSNVATVAVLSAPVNTTAPVIASTGSDISPMVGDDGVWEGNPIPTLTYVWQRDIAAVWTDSELTTRNATLTPIGEWRLEVTATNTEGTASEVSNTTTISTFPNWEQGAGPTVGTTTTTQALTDSTPVGRLIVVTVAQKYGANPPRDIDSVYDDVDGIGSPYTLAHSEVNGSGNLRIDVYYRVTTSAGVRTISSVLATAGDQTITVNEYSGATILGVTSGNGDNTTSATPGSITPIGTALYINTVATTDSYMDVTPDAAYTQRQEMEFGSGVTINTHDRVTSGAQNPTTTISSSVEWCAVIISFT